jgi:hypothetical protein
MSERKPTPRDFPVMFTMAEVRRIYRYNPQRTFVPCPCCRLAIDPRNRERHVRACRRRKRLAPDMWRQWRDDMYRTARTR